MADPRSYALFIETIKHFGSGGLDDTKRSLDHLLPVEACALSLLAAPLDPVARSILASKVGRPGSSRYISVRLRLPAHAPGEETRSLCPPAGRHGGRYDSWSYYANPHEYARNMYQDVGRSAEFLLGPSALINLGLNCDRRLVVDNQLCVDEIIRSPDSTLLTLSVFSGSVPLSTWLATAAAYTLTPSIAANYYSMDMYFTVLRSSMSITNLYLEARPASFVAWARVLPVPPGAKALNAWARDPAAGHLFFMLYSAVGVASVTAASPRDELKLIPLLQGADPLLIFLFALDVSAGPLIERATSLLTVYPAWRSLGCPKPLRNLFYAGRVSEGAPLVGRGAALRGATHLFNGADLQAALDSALDYEAERTGLTGRGHYYEASYMVLRWDLVELAMAENPGLIIRTPPTSSVTLNNYLRLSGPGQLAEGRIQLMHNSNKAFMLARIYSIYRMPEVRGSLKYWSVRDYWKIADWYGIDREEFEGVFAVDWLQTEALMGRFNELLL